MIITDFMGFLVLLIIGGGAAAVLHYGLEYYVVPGIWSFLSKVTVGFLGAWMGPVVFGHWFEGLVFGGIYFLPALLGAFALLILIVDVTKTLRHHPV